jgi:hypothetical protein
VDRRLWEADPIDRRSQLLAAIGAALGTPWALWLMPRELGPVSGPGDLLGGLALFGPGWLVYIGLVRRALGFTLWKDPGRLWRWCIAINTGWLILGLVFGLGSPVGVLGVISAAAFVALGVAGLRLERNRGADKATVSP